jgi:hypothetical protein
MYIIELLNIIPGNESLHGHDLSRVCRARWVHSSLASAKIKNLSSNSVSLSLSLSHTHISTPQRKNKKDCVEEEEEEDDDDDDFVATHFVDLNG